MTNAIRTKQRAAGYLRALMGNYALTSGIMYKSELQDARLDFSEASLQRVDLLLDHIRNINTLSFNDFINDLPRQNFLFALAFYTGKVIELNSASVCNWLTADEFDQVTPNVASSNEIRHTFIADFTQGTHGEGQYFPLVPIIHRLFDEYPDEKSVWFSAGMFMELSLK